MTPHGAPEPGQPSATVTPDQGAPCGCEQRRQALNQAVPGLGDAVKVVADPIYERWGKMPALLRPDMKSLVWLAIGAFVVPRLLTMVR